MPEVASQTVQQAPVAPTPAPAIQTQSIESLALSAAPAVGRSIISQSGIWALMFVLLVVANFGFAFYAGTSIIPAHLEKINSGHEKAWSALKEELAAERTANKDNFERERLSDEKKSEQLSRAIEALATRLDRAVDRWSGPVRETARNPGGGD